MRVLIAPDKFKGTLTARQAASAIAHGWKLVRRQDEVLILPISDGGDGFGPVLAGLRDTHSVQTTTLDAAGRRVVVRWWFDAARQTGIIESARVIGLALLPSGRFHPFDLDTRGLAALLRAAAKRGARRCLVGVGGSATNDGGYGLARGLGWKFLTRDRAPIERWTDLHRLATVVPPDTHDWPAEVVVAVDVQNKLLGPLGCTRIYGPQKGLCPRDFAVAEASLGQLAKVMRRTLGQDFARIAGAGAAGGLSFGLMAFAGAEITPGFELVAQEAGLAAQLRHVDLVITGEGQLDCSTFMGKGVGELAANCRRSGVPCIALGGAVKDRKSLMKKFAYVGVITDLTTSANARADAKSWLEKLAARAAQNFSA